MKNLVMIFSLLIGSSSWGAVYCITPFDSMPMNQNREIGVQIRTNKGQFLSQFYCNADSRSSSNGVESVTYSLPGDRPALSMMIEYSESTHQPIAINTEKSLIPVSYNATVSKLLYGDDTTGGGCFTLLE